MGFKQGLDKTILRYGCKQGINLRVRNKNKAICIIIVDNCD